MKHDDRKTPSRAKPVTGRRPGSKAIRDVATRGESARLKKTAEKRVPSQRKRAAGARTNTARRSEQGERPKLRAVSRTLARRGTRPAAARGKVRKPRQRKAA